jgi:ribosomal protein S18 acetylase RimI-like enzyme
VSNSVMPNGVVHPHEAPRVAAVAYFKRYKMEADLDRLPPTAPTPPDFRLLPWDDALLADHADVLYASFQREMDARVFPSLGDRAGCVSLMTAITRRFGFIPEATWLLVGPAGPCGSVQGLRERGAVGAIQNIGVTPAWRGRGLGETLMLHALYGFRVAGMARALLEVTAGNETAVRLYRRLGFRRSKTLYKAAPDLKDEG